VVAVDRSWERPSANHVRQATALLATLRGTTVRALPTADVASALWRAGRVTGRASMSDYACRLMHELAMLTHPRGVASASLPSDRAAAALSGLFAFLNANGKPVPPEVPEMLVERVSASLVMFDPADRGTWSELANVIEPFLNPEAEAAPRVLVVAPCSDRTPAQRDALTAECQSIGARAAALGLTVDYSDQKLHLPRDPRDISAEDQHLLRHADVVVFVLDGPSTGVGLLIGLAHRHRAIVAVVAPPQAQVEIGPTVLGMVLPHNALRAASTEGRLALAHEFLENRRQHAEGRQQLRRERQARYGRPMRVLRTIVASDGGVESVKLPSWFALARLRELLADEQGYATASPEELEDLAAALDIPPASLLPEGFVPSATQAGLSANQLRLAKLAADVEGWSVAEYTEILAEHLEEQELTAAAGRYVRWDVDLDRDVESWLDFAEQVRPRG
jgi:hypothetical protein